MGRLRRTIQPNVYEQYGLRPGGGRRTTRQHVFPSYGLFLGLSYWGKSLDIQRKLRAAAHHVKRLAEVFRAFIRASLGCFPFRGFLGMAVNPEHAGGHILIYISSCLGIPQCSSRKLENVAGESDIWNTLFCDNKYFTYLSNAMFLVVPVQLPGFLLFI